MYVRRMNDFHFSCTDLFPNASQLFPNKPNGSVQSPSADLNLGKASEFPGGEHRLMLGDYNPGCSDVGGGERRTPIWGWIMPGAKCM